MEHGVNEDERVSMHFSFLTQILLGSPFTPLSSLSFSPCLSFLYFLALSLSVCFSIFLDQSAWKQANANDCNLSSHVSVIFGVNSHF